jgi:hypothetical protein
MTSHRPILVIAGAICTALISFASTMAHGASQLEVLGVPGIVPTWLQMLVFLMMTYALGMLLGKVIWDRGN